MKFHTLDSFEKTLDPTIVARGKKYFQDGCVQEFEEREENTFTALVEGSEVYETKITINGNAIGDHSCNCPYDMGEFCKHKVALLFAIRNFFNEEDLPEKKEKKSPKKRKTIMDKLKEGMENLSPEELKFAILEYAQDDRYFRNFMMRKFPKEISAKKKGDLKKIYAADIKKCIRSAADRSGFVGYWEGRSAIKAANEFLNSAKNFLEKREYETVFAILQAEIETLHDSLERVDDSNGEFGNAIEETWEFFRQLCEKIPKDNPLKKEIFDYFLGEMPKKIYDGWYAWVDFSELAILLLENDEEEKRLFESLDGIEKQKQAEPLKSYFALRNGKMTKCYFGGISNHDLQKMIMLKRRILEARGKEEKSIELRDQHLQFSDFRLEKIESLWKEGDFEGIKKLAEEGIQIIEEQGGRNTEIFEIWILRIAKKENNTEKMRECWKSFFLKNTDWSAYESLKKSLSSEEWKKEFSNLCEAVSERNHWRNDTLLEMYEKEGLWEYIESFLEKTIEQSKDSWGAKHSLDLLGKWERVAKVHFSKKLITWYCELLRNYLRESMGREHYVKARKILCHLKKNLGEKEAVEKLKEEFLTLYKARRALVEELGKV